MENKKMTIKDIRILSGLSQAAFAEKYGIPKRSIENWEMSGTSKRKPPDYLVRLLERVVREDFESGE